MEKWVAKKEADKAAQRLRERRMRLLVRAFVRYEGDVKLAIEEMKLTPKELAEWSQDPWFHREMRSAHEMMEEGIIMHLFEMSMSHRAVSLQAAKVLLPALNKRRYNPAVQKQETANDGISAFMNAVSKKPMQYGEMVKTLIEFSPSATDDIIDVVPEPQLDMTIPTLDEAVASAGTLSQGKIAEEKDLPVNE